MLLLFELQSPYLDMDKHISKFTSWLLYVILSVHYRALWYSFWYFLTQKWETRWGKVMSLWRCFLEGIQRNVKPKEFLWGTSLPKQTLHSKMIMRGFVSNENLHLKIRSQRRENILAQLQQYLTLQQAIRSLQRCMKWMNNVQFSNLINVKFLGIVFDRKVRFLH